MRFRAFWSISEPLNSQKTPFLVIDAIAPASDSQQVRGQHPDLFQLFGGYLNQDWTDEYETIDAAIDDFAAGDLVLGKRTIKQLDDLLNTRDDNLLSGILEKLHLGYYYEADGFTARSWLEYLRSRFRGGSQLP
jgi:hypothetical protein